MTTETHWDELRNAKPQENALGVIITRVEDGRKVKIMQLDMPTNGPDTIATVTVDFDSLRGILEAGLKSLERAEADYNERLKGMQ